MQSRYYNPEIGRFLTADNPDYLGAYGTLQSYNLFAYCSNNPVMGKQRAVSSNSLIGAETARCYMPSQLDDSSMFNTVLASGSFRSGIIFGNGTVTGLAVNSYIGHGLSLKDHTFSLGGFFDFSVLNAQGQIGIGNDDISASLVGSADVGTVSGMLGIFIDPNNKLYGAGIDAQVALLAASGGLQVEINDVQIEVGGSINVLAAGVKYGLIIKDGELQYTSGMALIFGWDVYVKIKYQ